MPKVDFDRAKEIQPLPAGQYHCALDRIGQVQTQWGDPMWRLRFKVVEGPHAGRSIRDNLPFSEEALPRVKLLCESLGLDTAGEVDLTPAMVLGKECIVTVVVEPFRGRERRRVPFDGFASSARGGSSKQTPPF